MFENMHQFFLFVLFILLFSSGFILFIFSMFMIIELATRIYEKIVSKKLKNIIKRNPNIGLKDKDGNFVFKQGRFILKYRVVDLSDNAGQKKTELIFVKIILLGYEKKLKNFKRNVRRFWIYRKWTYFFEPRAIFLLLLIFLISYFTMFEPEHAKVNRLRWIISKLLKVNKESVAIKPDGWVKISGQRLTAVDKKIEPVSYNINLLDWFSFKDAGYIYRNRGVVENTDYGYVYYTIIYEDNGKVSLKKDEKWIENNSDADAITWEEAQGTGIREGKVLGHDVLRSKDNNLLIKDK
jgi:hypothetical protein